MHNERQNFTVLRAVENLPTPHRRSLNVGLFSEIFVMNDDDSITGVGTDAQPIAAPSGMLMCYGPLSCSCLGADC